MFRNGECEGAQLCRCKEKVTTEFPPLFIPEIAGLFCFSNLFLPSIFGVILSFFSVSKSSKKKALIDTYIIMFFKQKTEGRMEHFALHPQTEARLLIGDGDGGGGGGGGRSGGGGRRLNHGYCPKKTGETMDHRQNTGSVKAMSPRHCAVTSALRNCCFK